MSQTKKGLHKIEVRQRPDYDPSKAMTGATTQVFMDGKLLRGVSFFKFEVKAAGVAKVYMEMFADVDIELATQLPHKELKSTGFKTRTVEGEKMVGLYELSNLAPRAIAIEHKEENMGCSSAGSKPYCDDCGCGKKAAAEKLPKCLWCPKPVEAARYAMCYDCWWARDPRNK